jgi:hypothetical protein
MRRYDTQHNNALLYAECRILFTVMPSIIMLSVVAPFTPLLARPEGPGVLTLLLILFCRKKGSNLFFCSKDVKAGFVNYLFEKF